MKKLTLIFATILIVGCKKNHSCDCYKITNTSTGSQNYEYFVISKESRHKLKHGACASYSVIETGTTTIYQCNIN